jgi:hypothetical protein
VNDILSVSHRCGALGFLVEKTVYRVLKTFLAVKMELAGIDFKRAFKGILSIDAFLRGLSCLYDFAVSNFDFYDGAAFFTLDFAFVVPVC